MIAATDAPERHPRNVKTVRVINADSHADVWAQLEQKAWEQCSHLTDDAIDTDYGVSVATGFPVTMTAGVLLQSLLVCAGNINHCSNFLEHIIVWLPLELPLFVLLLTRPFRFLIADLRGSITCRNSARMMLQDSQKMCCGPASTCLTSVESSFTPSWKASGPHQVHTGMLHTVFVRHCAESILQILVSSVMSCRRLTKQQSRQVVLLRKCNTIEIKCDADLGFEVISKEALFSLLSTGGWVEAQVLRAYNKLLIVRPVIHIVLFIT